MPPSHSATQSVASPQLCMTLVFGQTLVDLIGDSTRGKHHCFSNNSNSFSSLSVSSSRFLMLLYTVNEYKAAKPSVRHLQATRNLMRTIAEAKAAAMSLQCCAVFQLAQLICWWAISSSNTPSFHIFFSISAYPSSCLSHLSLLDIY